MNYSLEITDVDKIGDHSKDDVTILTYKRCELASEVISDTLFPSCLTKLTLTDCNLQDVFILSLPLLTYLNIANNKIKIVDISGSLNLEVFIATSNIIMNVSLPYNVTVVDLSQNLLEDFEIFSSYPRLYKLILDENVFAYPENIKLLNCYQLKELSISGASFTECPNLPDWITKINFENCQISRIPYHANCEIMHLKGCLITEIKSDIIICERLTELVLDDNQLKEITFYPPNIEILNVQNNELIYVANFPPSMRSCDLSGNKLRNIPKLNENLEYVAFNDNKITLTKEDIPKSLRKIEIINTFVNPTIISEIIEEYPELTILHNEDNDIDGFNQHNDNDDFNINFECGFESINYATSSNSSTIIEFSQNKFNKSKSIHIDTSESKTLTYLDFMNEFNKIKTPKTIPEWKKRVKSNPYYLCNHYTVE